MQRNLQNLERLFIKYQARYGREDGVAKDISQAIEAKKSQDGLRRPWNVHYPRTSKRLGGRLEPAC